jgi:internalin A
MRLKITAQDTARKYVAKYTASREMKSALRSLEELELWGTKVTDTGLKQLKQLNNLRVVCLCRTGVTDTGLKELKKLRRLKTLCLQDTEVTDLGIR